MSKRADSHIHLFDGGYQGESFVRRPGVSLDEAACYESLAADHDVAAALVVGYDAESWTAGNNAFIAKMAARYDWVRPIAFVDPANPPGIDQLEVWRTQGFVGVSLYVFEQSHREDLQVIDDSVWSWIVEHRWLISVNSRGENWLAWPPILERHNQLRVVASHLGLPPKVAQPPSAEQAEQAIADLGALAQFPGPRVKLSGFYAATDPGHDYPHRAAWPYVEALTAAFGVERLLWGSDFSPHIEWLSFPQTFDLFSSMPFFNDADCDRIEGANLLALLDEAAH